MPARMTEYGIRITRTFDAPRERVWREWTEPERFADWFGGSEYEVPTSSVTMDVRPGGVWSLTMAGPRGREIHWTGEYHEVDEPARLVFTVTDEPDNDARELVIVELREVGEGQTEMHFEQRGSLPPETYEAAEKGWGGMFERIAERLAAG
jgi:uncharacterized protein YndB with AHSA1/START domain